MLPYGKVQSGTLVATASAPIDIQISSMNPPTYFEMRNISQWGATSAAKDIEFWWQKSMAQGTFNGIHQASGGAGSQTLNAFNLTSDGLSFYSTATPPSFTPNTSGTAFTRGSANGVTVATITNDGNAARGPKVNVGDFVRLTNVVAMEQISGFVFQVVAITSTTSVTLDMDSSGFAADGTTFTMQKVIPSRYYPRVARVTAISQTNPLVANLVQDCDYTVGEEVSFRIPPNMTNATLGNFSTMTGLANLKGVVTAVKAATSTTCSQVTVNIDTSGFTAFTLPTSAQAVVGIGQQPVSLIVPAGSGVIPSQNPPGTNLLDAFDNRNIWVIHLGGTVFANSTTGDVWEWKAVYADEYNNQ
jgi:hypothetical protein